MAERRLPPWRSSSRREALRFDLVLSNPPYIADGDPATVINSFAVREVAASWETERTFLIILAWLIAGLIISIRSFKWKQDR